MIYTPKNPYSHKNPYSKQDPYDRKTAPYGALEGEAERFLSIDGEFVLLIDEDNKLLIQPASEGEPYTNKDNPYSKKNPYSRKSPYSTKESHSTKPSPYSKINPYEPLQ